MDLALALAFVAIAARFEAVRASGDGALAESG
jgi:hypothetical protein